MVNLKTTLVSKRNIEALGRVEFSARINFSANDGLRIEEVENITSIEPIKLDLDFTPNELEVILAKIRTKKQKELLTSHFLDLKQIYVLEGSTAFNKKCKSINGLGRATKTLLLSSFKEN